MQPPKYSIIVPTRGRPAALGSCIQALGRLDYPPDRYEVIVVFDGDSPIDLPDINPVAVQIVSQAQSGPAAARNKGASLATGDYLAFTDDDCTPAPDWLLKLTAVFEQYPERMVGGKIVNALPDNPYASASQLLVDFLYEYHNSNPSRAQFLTSNNMALPGDLFWASRGFDTSFPLAAGEDRALCRRWLREGHRIYYDSAALVYHNHPLSLVSFWRQHVAYGRGAYRFRHKQALQKHERLHLESLSFYFDLLRYPLRRQNGRRALILFLLFLMMQLANTAGFLFEWFRRWIYYS